ncbi:hypothetical protein [Streptomyces sp. NPDC059883]|uniref:hypothetical protein n=1 Tax=unclassified Streptomyces TaxID=2593676 RepID=UPI00365D02C7
MAAGNGAEPPRARGDGRTGDGGDVAALTGTVSARTLAAGAPMLLAAAADSSGGGGDYSATPLSPTATWEAGGSTGDFTWNYPLRVPPATAGPSPNLSISYNSASVDGRTAGENNQTSVIGEGFSITESYIEREYGSCKDDGQSGKGDQCWKYANATLVLNGKAVELVNTCADKATCDTAALSEASGGSWKVRSEDGTRVEHLTGATGNGDNNTEYWKVTDTSGAQYFFGKHRLPGWSDKGTTDTADDDPVTNSVWTVPVFGDDSGEPCYKSTGFGDSFCNQAWRWNLDYVVDTHGNASTYWYGREANYYSKNADTTVNDYVYDATGNVKSVTDSANGKDTQCFAYDGYRRLTEAWTPSSDSRATARSASALGGPAPYWTSWTYKPGGLRDTQTEHKAAGSTTTAYGYPAVSASGTGQPHTLTSVTVNGGTAKSYAYDEQGNTTKRYGPTGTAQSLTWDIEGEPTRLTEGTRTTDYLYDANGDLLIRRGASKSVLYLAGQELHYDTAAKKFTAQRYYPAGDITAVHTETGLSWMVDDHHGTASMTVDATTQAVTRRYTKPFGNGFP